MDAIIWLILLVVFLLAEAASVAMVSLWFAAGALVAMVASLLGASRLLQMVLFLVVAAALLASMRPLLRKYFTPKLIRTNVDAIVDSQGYVTADIDNLAATGSVKLGAMEWTARSADGQPIPKGTLVSVEKIEGVKVFVTPVPMTETV